MDRVGVGFCAHACPNTFFMLVNLSALTIIYKKKSVMADRTPLEDDTVLVQKQNKWAESGRGMRGQG